MDIGVSKDGDIPVREQIFAQIVFLIGTRRLKPGDALPSVRALAKRLGIHHNTVSEAYQELVSKGFVSGRRGGRLTVRFPDELLNPSQQKDLDDLINETIKSARQQGYTLQQLRRRVRERLLEAAPDHILVVSEEAAMQQLLRIELSELQPYPIETCSTDDLAANAGLASGALIVTPPGTMPKVVSLLPKSQPAIAIVYSEAGEQLAMVRESAKPCLIAVVSISPYFLEIARGVLSPMIGDRHAMSEYLLTGSGGWPAGCADIVFCDCIAYRQFQSAARRKTAIPYRLISDTCVEQIRSMMADLAVE